ncbi:hypothetical protein N9Z96_00765 [bacterium]|nr:hypothetical protein [bacterium]
MAVIGGDDMGSVLLKQLGILIGIIVVSATAAAGIRSFTGGCCGSCCQQPPGDTAPAE